MHIDWLPSLGRCRGVDGSFDFCDELVSLLWRSFFGRAIRLALVELERCGRRRLLPK